MSELSVKYAVDTIPLHATKAPEIAVALATVPNKSHIFRKRVIKLIISQEI
jgi:hypothetical protein